MDNVYKFVSWDVKPLENYKDTNCYKLMEKLNNGLKLTREEKDSLNLKEYKGSIHVMGYSYNFRPYCKRYVVNYRYYGWVEYYAFDKTHLRNMLGAYNVLEILQA